MPEVPKFLCQSKSELESKYAYIKKLQYLRFSDSQHRGSEWCMNVGIDHDRNRYSNIVPYDKTRVKLQVAPGFDDYINASHITIDLQKYAKGPKRYIASQGPTRTSTDVFWQMCFDEVQGENIVIVMVTPLVENGMEKCFKYWPGDQCVVKGGDMFKGRDLVIEKLSEKDVSGEFVVSHFKITDQGSQKWKNVYHLYYDKWRDFSKPLALEPLKMLSDYANSHIKSATDPLFVHCSAGVGRTGTFITLNYMLSCSLLFSGQDSDVGDVDLIDSVVYQLRDQRLLMVERVLQYIFIYESLKEYFIEKFT